MPVSLKLCPRTQRQPETATPRVPLRGLTPRAMIPRRATPARASRTGSGSRPGRCGHPREAGTGSGRPAGSGRRCPAGSTPGRGRPRRGRQPSSSGQSRILWPAASRISCASSPARLSGIPSVGHSQTNSRGPAGGSGHAHQRDKLERGLAPPRNIRRMGPSGSASPSGPRPPRWPMTLVPSASCSPETEGPQRPAGSRAAGNRAPGPGVSAGAEAGGDVDLEAGRVGREPGDRHRGPLGPRQDQRPERDNSREPGLRRVPGTLRPGRHRLSSRNAVEEAHSLIVAAVVPARQGVAPTPGVGLDPLRAEAWGQEGRPRHGRTGLGPRKAAALAWSQERRPCRAWGQEGRRAGGTAGAGVPGGKAAGAVSQVSP
jgi:hypothetical protein